jgi:hypothetical protein
MKALDALQTAKYMCQTALVLVLVVGLVVVLIP